MGLQLLQPLAVHLLLIAVHMLTIEWYYLSDELSATTCLSSKIPAALTGRPFPLVRNTLAVKL